MASNPPSLRAVEFPRGAAPEADLHVRFLGYLRESIITRVEDLTDDQARWRPDDKLISLLGIVRHLTEVEYRWIEKAYLGNEVRPSARDEEFAPPASWTVANTVAAYRERGAITDAALLDAASFDVACKGERAVQAGIDLRWVAIHLVEETARHAGHADSTREMLDGARGE